MTANSPQLRIVAEARPEASKPSGIPNAAIALIAAGALAAPGAITFAKTRDWAATGLALAATSGVAALAATWVAVKSLEPFFNAHDGRVGPCNAHDR